MVYGSEKESSKNKFEIAVGETTLKANVVPEAGFKKIHLGTVNLLKGENTISVKATTISSGELMKLRAVLLEPVQ